ncbi:hypothetical protein D7D52_30420 [Nocardia yunnanensis]|uniref:DUF8020 domain-containing protein n=1 Tax=Nocardia yunnanensis TaxID=2382165 RepID=A0A386ZIQ2_9NOCA|nr:hypothetical protein [Nocardia yunnanensis]AYF77418.1 hypothetical protein D7D52_30420 [Nocardia yunnanensis]
MRTKGLAAVTALVAAVTAITAGTVNAEANTGDLGIIHYTASATDRSAIISTDAGSMDVENGVFKIKGADGTVVAGQELSFRVDDFVFPIAAAIKDNSATLTPLFDMSHASYQPVALPFEDTAPWKTPYDREQAAWNRMKDTIAIGATIGTLVGGIGGAAVGCALGGIAVGSGATLATGIIGGLFFFLPGAVVGCLAGAAAMGALGAVGGMILVSAPVAIAAAVQYFTTINQPFTPPAK